MNRPEQRKVGSSAWNDETHVRVFDYRSAYPSFLLRRHFERFNEGRLLRAQYPSLPAGRFYEIGCATGETYRYVRRYMDKFDYYGFDVSEPAIRIATQRHGADRFFRIDGDLGHVADQYGRAKVVFCRDVVMHQQRPYDLLTQLINLAEVAVFVRLRTRDVGETVADPELSCQCHYDNHWVPYIVLNTDEMISRISAIPGVRSILISRRHEVLGGINGRFLPKELYFSAAGGAETAVCVLKDKNAAAPATVAFDDKVDGRFTLFERVLRRLLMRRAATI